MGIGGGSVTKKQIAHRLARRLSANDARIDKAAAKAAEKPFGDYLDGLLTKRKTLVKEALDQGLKIVSISVGDGYALYYEVRRMKTQSRFEWLYSPDAYVSDFGGVVTIPNIAADKLIKRFNLNYL
jgi:hypothetical protein